MFYAAWRCALKKDWEQPLLVSLTRGDPAEALLSACKILVNNTGPKSTHSGCHQAPTMLCEERARNTRIASGTPVCTECSEQLPS